jgi:hypothetical protein
MIDRRVHHVVVLKNCVIVVCDADGNALAEYHGNLRRNSALLSRVRSACGPGVEWIGTEHLSFLNSPFSAPYSDWKPPLPPGYSTQEQRAVWRKLVAEPSWEGRETEAAVAAITQLLAEVELVHAELRVAKAERDESSKRSIVDRAGFKVTTESLEKRTAELREVTAERDRIASDALEQLGFTNQLLDGLVEYLPRTTPRTVAGTVAAVRQLHEDGSAMTAEKNARINAGFQKFLQLGSVVAAKLKPGHANVRCPRCCLRHESSGSVPAACPHCADVHVGIGRSFDEACADAVLRLREQGQNDVWRVLSHLLYTADVADRDAPDVNLVHMVRLGLEPSL